MKWLLFASMPAGMFAATDSGLPGWALALVGVATFIAVATKQLVPGWVYKDLAERLAAEEADNARLTATLLNTQPTTIAALQESTKLVNDLSAELRVLRRAT